MGRLSDQSMAWSGGSAGYLPGLAGSEGPLLEAPPTPGNKPKKRNHRERPRGGLSERPTPERGDGETSRSHRRPAPTLAWSGALAGFISGLADSAGHLLEAPPIPGNKTKNETTAHDPREGLTDRPTPKRGVRKTSRIRRRPAPNLAWGGGRRGSSRAWVARRVLLLSPLNTRPTWRKTQKNETASQRPRGGNNPKKPTLRGAALQRLQELGGSAGSSLRRPVISRLVHSANGFSAIDYVA